MSNAKLYHICCNCTIKWLLGAEPRPITSKRRRLNYLTMEKHYNLVQPHLENSGNPTPEYRKINIKIGNAAKKRKRFLLANGVSPEDAKSLCLLPMDKLLKLLGESPSITFVPESIKIPNSQGNGLAFHNAILAGNLQGTMPYNSVNYPSMQQQRKSRWNASPQRQPCQTNPQAISATKTPTQFLSTAQNLLLQPNSSFAAAVSGATQAENASKQKTITDETVNDNDCASLMVQPIAILLREFPRCKLTCSQMEAIEEAIVDKVLHAAENIKPQFYGTTYEAGYLAMHCCNNATAEWIKKIITSIKPWTSADIWATEEANAPYSKVIVGQFLSSADLPTEVILDNIKQQNPQLNVDHWQVIARQNIDAVAMLALSIDRISAEKLEANKKRISFRLVQVILHFEDENLLNTETNV